MKFSSNWVRPLLRLLFALFLLSPFLIWLIRIEKWSFPSGTDLMGLLAVTMWQSAGSAVLSLVLGTILCFCIEGFRQSKILPAVELALLAPNLLPPLFVIVAVMSLGVGSRFFPMGLGAVILTHALINAGLVAVALRRIFQHKMGGMLALAEVEGASRFRTFFKVVLPYLKGDFASLFVFVFSLCLTSLSIPLVLGGPRASSFEIAIYQTIRLEGAWAQAVVLAMLQSLALFFVALIIPKPFTPMRASRSFSTFFSWPRWRYLVFSPALLLLLGWALSFVGQDGSVQIEMSDQILPAAMNTLVIAMSVGLMHLALLLLVSYLLPHAGLSRFLNGYLVPSGAIIGFAFLLVPGDSDRWMTFKLIVALTLWSFPILFRWLASPMLVSLTSQIHVARTLGAGPGLILWRVIFPQCAGSYFTAAGLAALWASGDFALSSILGGTQWTWALLIQDFLSFYRLDLASLMLIPLLFLGLLCYGFFRGLGRYVAG